MTTYRTEEDLLGQKEIPANALYGIHTQRAVDNFPISGKMVNPALIHAFGAVKLACLQTNNTLGFIDNDQFVALTEACNEMMNGALDDYIIVDALQGGAGTSTNMNVNEVLANRALQIMGKKAGDYDIIHPIETVNLHQSTNDTYPTALKVATINRLKNLELYLTSLLEEFQNKEKEFADVVKIGRTQLQDAVLSTMGRTISSFTEAISRDRWRIYKSVERVRVINLGGTAIGTGLTAPRKYIFKVTENLKRITGYSLARAENLVEATQNTDCFVEVSGIMTSCASNLMKICNDLRFLSCGPKAGIGELILPEKQAGSSIMPGKINPVIPECVIQAAIQVMSNNQTIIQSCSMGNLELNAFLPLIANSMLESLDLLANACSILNKHCIHDLKVNENRCKTYVESSTATLTALVDIIGYEKAQEISLEMEESHKSIKEIILAKKYLTEDEFNTHTSPEAVTKLGS